MRSGRAAFRSSSEAKGARFVDVDGHRVRRLLPRRHRRDDRTRAAPTLARDRPGGQGHHADAADRGRPLGRGGAYAPFGSRPGSSRSRRPTPTASRSGWRATSPAAEHPRLQLVLPRHRRRDVRDAGATASSRARRQPRPAGRSGGDDARRRVQRLDGLERELAHGDVALVLAEPALTNIGIVHPEPGSTTRSASSRAGTATLLAIDETHTICCGPGGYTRRTGSSRTSSRSASRSRAASRPRPTASRRRSRRARRRIELEDVDVGGIGGTLAGNALSLAAMRATLARC